MKLLLFPLLLFSVSISAQTVSPGFTEEDTPRTGLFEERVADNVQPLVTVQQYPIPGYHDLVIESSHPFHPKGVHPGPGYIDIVIAWDHDGDNVPMESDEIWAILDGKLISSQNLSLDDLNRRIAFDIILDKSGSMRGAPIKKLESVVTEFLAKFTDESYDCRISWFSEKIYRAGGIGYQPCQKYSSGITIPPAGGGTFIYPALKDAYSALHKLDSGIFTKAIFIVSDGEDQTPYEQITALKTLKDSIYNDIYTFIYIIAEDGSLPKVHVLHPLGDDFFYEQGGFSNKLTTYLANVGAEYYSSRVIRVQLSK